MFWPFQMLFTNRMVAIEALCSGFQMKHAQTFSVDCIINEIKCHPATIPVVNYIELKSLNNIDSKESRTLWKYFAKFMMKQVEADRYIIYVSMSIVTSGLPINNFFLCQRYIIFLRVMQCHLQLVLLIQLVNNKIILLSVYPYEYIDMWLSVLKGSKSVKFWVLLGNRVIFGIYIRSRKFQVQHKSISSFLYLKANINLLRLVLLSLLDSILFCVSKITPGKAFMFQIYPQPLPSVLGKRPYLKCNPTTCRLLNLNLTFSFL